VGKIIDHTAGGDLVLHWFANPSNNPFLPYLPGWTNETGARYYAKHPATPSHTPYTSRTEYMDIHQCDVVLHSFNLSAVNRLSMRVLTELAENPLVWWTKSPAELAATALAWDAAAQARTEEVGDRALEIRDKGETVEDPEVGEEDAEHDASDLETDDGGETIRDKGDTDDTVDDGAPADTDDEGATKYWDTAAQARAAEFTKAHEDFEPMVALHGKRGAEPSTTHPSKRPKTDEPSIVRTRVGRKIMRPSAFCNTVGPTPMSEDSGAYQLL
jgi:hypothetical protein